MVIQPSYPLVPLPFPTPRLADGVTYLGPGSGRLRECALNGIVGNEGPGKLGCADYTCACQSLFSKAVTAVSTTVEDACSNNQVDVTSAILNVYELCTDNNFSPTLTITASTQTGKEPCQTQLTLLKILFSSA